MDVCVTRHQSKHFITFLPGSDANPIIKESFAKQLLRSKRQERPLKAGHPDEPMRVRFIQSKEHR